MRSPFTGSNLKFAVWNGSEPVVWNWALPSVYLGESHQTILFPLDGLVELYFHPHTFLRHVLMWLCTYFGMDQSLWFGIEWALPSVDVGDSSLPSSYVIMCMFLFCSCKTLFWRLQPLPIPEGKWDSCCMWVLQCNCPWIFTTCFICLVLSMRVAWNTGWY
jgi:hypothetical protein